MEMSDHLEGLKSSTQMVSGDDGSRAAKRPAPIACTSNSIIEDGGGEFYLSRPDRREGVPRQSFGDRAGAHRPSQVVHVPIAASDPVASTFHSVRSEGISAAVALPIKALGKTLGVVYTDCTQ